MNRDEKLVRVKGLPPDRRVIDGRQILCPSEPGGGTWIALNDCGVTFALINWYSITARVGKNPVSRGDVVNAVCATDSIAKAANALAALPLKRINPFRLITVIATTKKIIEWRWDFKSLSKRVCDWKTQQWISSGFDEPQAQRIRSATFRAAIKQKKSGTIDWLRRLHRSHAPACGPFSTCMHRADAATVSYTEISVSSGLATMRYSPSSLCETLKPQCVVKLNI